MTDQNSDLIQDLEIKIDLSSMTFGDLEDAMKWQGGRVGPEVIPLLNRIVVGGVRHIPIRYMSQIMEAVNNAIQENANPN